MKAINYGNKFEIHDDSLKTFDQLPVQSYVVRFEKFAGFYLEQYFNFEIKEEKIYGAHPKKVQKILSSFEKFNRNLGVILSGDKGIGKSLFAKMLAIEVQKKGIPVIVVDRYIQGIASYLESINQEVMILFDEFDKTFADVKVGDDSVDPQASLLSLFDGVSEGKKLFVITCNNIKKLNSYYVNRPGRFHYHIQFDYPTINEIKTYLKDKVDEKYLEDMDKIIAFSKRINLNYDCLRAIAFELSNGVKFDEAVKDLNIVNTEEQTYIFNLRFTDGSFATLRGWLDFYDNKEHTVYFDNNEGQCIYSVEFNNGDAKFDINIGLDIIERDRLKIINISDEDDNNPYEGKEVQCLTIKREEKRNIHFLV